jgi:hypothetical protein
MVLCAIENRGNKTTQSILKYGFLLKIILIFRHSKRNGVIINIGRVAQIYWVENEIIVYCVTFSGSACYIGYQLIIYTNIKSLLIST